MKKISFLLVLLLGMVGTVMGGTCPPGPPASRGNGQVAGVAIPGGSRYYMKDSLIENFDCFEQLSAWFPSYFHSSNSISPTQILVDMAYAAQATATFFNVVGDGVSRVDVLDITAGGTPPTCSGAPNAPGGLSATAVSSSQINLNWTASTAPSGCTVGHYNVFRSTTAGFTPSGSNQIASGVTTTSYDDVTAVCATTYHYAVEAVDSVGASAASTQASATTNACPMTGSVQINSGGPAVSPFVADEDFAGGGTINHANTIDLSGVTNPAPMAVYQTARTGNFTYTIPGFGSGSSQTVRLHFAETFFSTTGSRVFNVKINGTQVLTNFDIFAAAGAKNKAVIKQFTENASSTGDYVITFTSVVNNSLVSGIEVQ